MQDDTVIIINDVFQFSHIVPEIDTMSVGVGGSVTYNRSIAASLYLAAGYTVDDFVDEIKSIAKSGVEKTPKCTKSYVFGTKNSYINIIPQRARLHIHSNSVSEYSKSTLELVGNELYEVRVSTSASFLEDMLFHTVSRGNR